MRHVGVDGCKAGWLAVTRNDGRLDYSVYRNIAELTRAFPGAEPLLIDIPIGLPSSDAPVRACDRLARQRLGTPRKSSVFPVPCREALGAADLSEAKAINRARLGRSLGAQTWGISPKIAEVDRFLLARGTSRPPLREIHPEVCFWALACGRPMKHKKSTMEGRAERIELLARYEPDAERLLSRVLAETLRKDVAADDVLDAVVAFVTSEARVGALTALVGDPSRDAAGLPIEMLYLKVRDKDGSTETDNDARALWSALSELGEHFSRLGGAARYVGMSDSDIPLYVACTVAQRNGQSIDLGRFIDQRFPDAAAPALERANCHIAAVGAKGDKLAALVREFCSHADSKLKAQDKSPRWKEFVRWVQDTAPWL